MKFHILRNGERIASFKFETHRDEQLAIWIDRFAYAATEFEKENS